MNENASYDDARRTESDGSHLAGTVALIEDRTTVPRVCNSSRIIVSALKHNGCSNEAVRDRDFER